MLVRSTLALFLGQLPLDRQLVARLPFLSIENMAIGQSLVIPLFPHCLLYSNLPRIIPHLGIL